MGGATSEYFPRGGQFVCGSDGSSGGGGGTSGTSGFLSQLGAFLRRQQRRCSLPVVSPAPPYSALDETWADMVVLDGVAGVHLQEQRGFVATPAVTRACAKRDGLSVPPISFFQSIVEVLF